ncbi:hypothetical protein SK128_004378 [Halocaridina rubra]|uniref:Uncharacterized protein n=1 Tax=Halocaridina rubra TaxID=373956 RepID=A0AAN8WEA2_HALRR
MFKSLIVVCSPSDAMLAAPGQHLVYLLQVCKKVLVEQEDVVHNLDAVHNTPAKLCHLGNRRRHWLLQSPWVLCSVEPAAWHDESGEVSVLLGEFQLPVAMYGIRSDENLGRQCDAVDGRERHKRGMSRVGDLTVQLRQVHCDTDTIRISHHGYRVTPFRGLITCRLDNPLCNRRVKLFLHWTLKGKGDRPSCVNGEGNSIIFQVNLHEATNHLLE